jgi:AcrR family transcriptional regulator
MVRVVGTKGYRETAVADVLEEADASRAAFDNRFRDKHDCFLEAYAMLTDRLFDTVVSNCDGEQPWLERMTAGLEALVGVFAADPQLARTAVVEVGVAGADARLLHWNAVTRFADFMAPEAELAQLPASTALMSASGVAGLLFDQLSTGRAVELPELLPDLTFALLVPYLGPRAATEEMWRVTRHCSPPLRRERIAG